MAVVAVDNGETIESRTAPHRTRAAHRSAAALLACFPRKLAEVHSDLIFDLHMNIVHAWHARMHTADITDGFEKQKAAPPPPGECNKKPFVARVRRVGDQRDHVGFN